MYRYVSAPIYIQNTPSSWTGRDFGIISRGQYEKEEKRKGIYKKYKNGELEIKGFTICKMGGGGEKAKRR
jgi:hypothetical protein